ncbi:rhodanese-like domain-containing protein [Undibacterium pigrum]|uniref:Rhodanese-related sulfurtransferase n=1 Tax=Undibacterium pigrum TaxID=401470 RepID=A0A318IZ81_9BURK|nr:rhodanese-like domain-containing protein [Undibacterium pigrum]PXX41586.1 rhodanese-related sulfurtransferase [Undibacterium pigrum]
MIQTEQAEQTRQIVSVAEFMRELSSANPPAVIDVRKRPAFEADTLQVVGAVWLDPEQVASWAPALTQQQNVVVYCIKGHEVGINCASALNSAGIAARYLEGGLEAYKQAGGMLARRAG